MNWSIHIKDGKILYSETTEIGTVETDKWKTIIFSRAVEDDYTPPSYETFFNFIESEDGARFLSLAEKGELSFKSAFDIIRSANALPQDSSKLIWAVILSLFHGVEAVSARYWNARVNRG